VTRALTWTQRLLGAAAWCCTASNALAHFPIARAVALEQGGGTAAAVALPGFGIVMRPDAQRPFAYICDALLEAEQSDIPPAMAFMDDGSLLIGTGSGLRSVSRDGCPRAADAGNLQSQPVVALAAHPGAPSLVYAVTGGVAPRVERSHDGGRTWELRALLPADPVTALVLDDSDPDVVYVSQSTLGGGAPLRVSEDGGASFATFQENDGLVVLHVESSQAADAGTGRLWAVGRDRAKPSAFAVFDAPRPQGPWKSILTVNYFGGFVRDPNGVIWIGDEGGGVYRSADGGVTFNDVAAQTGVACLDFAQGSLFGCTPGLTQQSALSRWNDDRQAFDDVVALANVHQMVECSAPTDVQTTCAAAWVEWERDVVGLHPSSRDAGTTPGESRAAGSSGGCSVSRSLEASNGRSRSSTSSRSAYALGVLLLGASARRSRKWARLRRERFQCSHPGLTVRGRRVKHR
jgi:hypothetical protein